MDEQFLQRNRVLDLDGSRGDLERENAALRELLQQRTNELQSLRGEVVGMIVHEIRNPMTVMGGLAQVLLSSWERLPEGDKKDFIRRIQRGVLQLGEVVEAVVQLTQVEGSAFNFNMQPFHPGAFVHSVIDDLKRITPRERFVVDAPPDLPLVKGDEHRTWQVLMNLLENAVKYSPERSEIEVSVSAADRSVEFCIADRGDGIAPEDIPKVFEKFSRVGSARTTRNGSGLGLYICKRLIEGQGGSIDAKARDGGGSVFRISLPVAEDSVSLRSEQ